MLKKINSVTVLGFIAIVSLIMTAGFVEGGNTIGAVVSIAVMAVSGLLMVREDGQQKR